PGEPLHEGMRWRVHTHPSSHRRALPLVPQPGRAAWDRYGLHEPSYVEGLSADGSGRPVRRLYYTGRSSPTSVGNTPPYSMGRLPRFYTRAEGLGTAFVHGTPEGLAMLLRKSPKLLGDDSYPEQKLWISSSARASGEISDWWTPTPVLDAESGPAWYRGGFFG